MRTLEHRRLSSDEAKRLGDTVYPVLGFLHRLRDRVGLSGFDPDGELARAVAKAYDAIHHLSIVLHYESCSGGVGRRQENK